MIHQQANVVYRMQQWVWRCCPILVTFSFILIALFIFPTVAQAQAIVVSDRIPPKNTNWVDELQIPPFHPEWGRLTAITLTFEAPITGSVSYENTSSATVSITTTHRVTAALELPDGSVLLAVPNAARVDSVPPFDGISDFGGESGSSFMLTTTMVVTTVFSSPAQLAFFYGEDPIRFPITATGNSRILGPGNFDAIFRAQAASVTFTAYFAYVPPNFAMKKFINQRDADDANGNDVPVIAPGAPIQWTYLITNTGGTPIPLEDIQIIDSDRNVIPIFEPTSDDGDRILSPGEVWRYSATGTAVDLRLDNADITIVPGCQGAPTPQTMRAYQNIVTVSIGDIQQTDPSHYCNPTPRRLEPSLVLAKLINGLGANDPDGLDVPYVFPGEPLTWTYVITNTGDISFTFEQINLTDDDPALTITFDGTSDNGDNLLAPNEVWRFRATGIAHNLRLDTETVNTVDGCDPDNLGKTSNAYRNIATIVVGEIVATDPAHYCNFPPTVVAEREDPPHYPYSLFVPLIASQE